MPESDDFLKEDREFVVPGDQIIKSMDYLPGRNCFRDGDSLVAKKIGLVSIDKRVVSVIPLNTTYLPQEGDMVICQVVGIESNGWALDIHSIGEAFLPLSGVREFIEKNRTDLSKYHSIGDLLYAKVSSVEGIENTYMTMKDRNARKLEEGQIVEINPAKIPRLIGRKGSMVNLIKDKTGCRIHIGQNGLVWLRGENEPLAIQAVNMVEKEAHSEGLTDKVGELLEKEQKKEERE